MTFYSILENTPTTDAWVAAYIEPTNAAIARHGGKVLARTANHERLEGDRESPTMRVILEWPSREAAMAFMNDPEYVPHLKARTLGSLSHHCLIEGKDDLAG